MHFTTILVFFFLFKAETTRALKCFECTSYNRNCGLKIVNETKVPTIPCGKGNYCFTKIDSSDVVYRGCTDRFYIKSFKNLWTKRNDEKWCHCNNQDYCNIDNRCGEKLNIIKTLVQTTIASTTKTTKTEIASANSKCTPWSCFNSGLCLEVGSDYSVCVCAPDFTGINCETKKA